MAWIAKLFPLALHAKGQGFLCEYIASKAVIPLACTHWIIPHYKLYTVTITHTHGEDAIALKPTLL